MTVIIIDGAYLELFSAIQNRFSCCCTLCLLIKTGFCIAAIQNRFSCCCTLCLLIKTGFSIIVHCVMRFKTGFPITVTVSLIRNWFFNNCTLNLLIKTGCFITLHCVSYSNPVFFPSPCTVYTLSAIQNRFSYHFTLCLIFLISVFWKYLKWLQYDDLADLACFHFS